MENQTYTCMIDTTDTGGSVLLRELDEPRLNSFIEQILSSQDSKKYAAFTFPVPVFDPLAALELLSKENEFNFYWEKPEQQLAFAAGKTLVEFKTEGPERFKKMGQKIEQIKPVSANFSAVKHSLAGIHLLGGFSFFDSIVNGDWRSFGSASLTLPEWLLIKDGKFGLLTITIKIGSGDTKIALKSKMEARLREFYNLYHIENQVRFQSNGKKTASAFYSPKSNQTDYSWLRTVEDAKNLIRKKAFKKIVLAHEVHWQTELPINPTFVLNKIRNEYPSCYNFLIKDAEGKAFIGCSPERLVSFQKNYLLTESLAGSIPRGKTATEDVYLEKSLINSPKNRKEHHYVTKAIEKRLRPFTKKIEKPKDPEIKKLKNVQHLFTPISGWLNETADRFSILEQLHPTPAVGGYPRERAMPYIKELESFDRGWYAGPVGWLNLSGGGEFTVAIRSGLINKNEARVFAGCGIVEDSDPMAEWEEINLKLMPILSAFASDEVKQSE